MDNLNRQYDIHNIVNYTNIVVDEHGILTFDVVIVVLLLLFDVFVPHSSMPVPYNFWTNNLNVGLTRDLNVGSGVNMKQILGILVLYLMTGLTYIYIEFKLMTYRP